MQQRLDLAFSSPLAFPTIQSCPHHALLRQDLARTNISTFFFLIFSLSQWLFFGENESISFVSCFVQVLLPAVAVGPGLQPPLMLLQLTLTWQVSVGLFWLGIGAQGPSPGSLCLT